MTTDQPARFTADDYADAAELLQMLIPNYGTFQPSAFPKLTNVILDALARQAAEPGEPVAWRVKDFGDGWIATNNKTVVRNCIAEGHIVEPLYAHPPAPAPSAPGGWQEAIEAADKATIVIETHLGTETWIRTGISKPALATPASSCNGRGGMSDTIAGRTMAEWTTLSRRDDACERIVPSDLRALLGEIARLRAPDRSREGLEAELRTALKRIAGSAEAFLRHFNPHDFAEDKAQQYFSLSDQVAFAKRLLAVTPPAPDASPVAKDWLAFNDPFFTDGEPYCNTVRFISKADAIAQRKRQHKEVAGADFPGTDNEALFEFISVNWAWEVPSPLPAPDASGGRDGAAEERALRARCQHVANTIMQDAMLRQNSAVDTLFSFVSKEIKAAIEAGDHLPKPGGSDA